MVRGKYDLYGVIDRTQGRSKYGTKRRDVLPKELRSYLITKNLTYRWADSMYNTYNLW